MIHSFIYSAHTYVNQLVSAWGCCRHGDTPGSHSDKAPACTVPVLVDRDALHTQIITQTGSQKVTSSADKAGGAGVSRDCQVIKEGLVGVEPLGQS